MIRYRLLAQKSVRSGMGGDRSPMGKGRGPKPARRKSWLQQHCRACPECWNQGPGEADNMEERQMYVIDVITTQPLLQGADLAGPQQIGMSPEHGLGRRGRSGREEDHRGSGGVRRPARSRARVEAGEAVSPRDLAASRRFNGFRFGQRNPLELVPWLSNAIDKTGLGNGGTRMQHGDDASKLGRCEMGVAQYGG